MGCCSSIGNRSSYPTSSPTANKGSVTSAQAPRSSISQVKSPPSIEEETVKEVLSEKPKWKPTTLSNFEGEKPTNFDKFEREIKKNERKTVAMATTINKGEEISEVSEVCSLSESVSTTTIIDRREEEEETRKRVNRSPARVQKNRSFSGEFAGKRERVVGKSPARRMEQSPGRRNGGSVKVVQSRDQIGNGGTTNHPRRRDAGENSGRRSMSPATRTETGATRSVVGRSPSARRRTNRSPSRVKSATPESGGGRKMVSSTTEEGKWQSSNQSLENPLVSLECFIFL